MTLSANLSPSPDPAPLEWIKMIARFVILGPLRVLVSSFSALKWFICLKLRADWVEVLDLIPDGGVFCMDAHLPASLLEKYAIICISRCCEVSKAKFLYRPVYFHPGIIFSVKVFKQIDDCHT